MFLREIKPPRVARLTHFRSIDIDVESLTGIAWEKVNTLLRVNPRMMFMPVNMATLGNEHIKGNLISYAIYARDIVLFKMLKHFAQKHCFSWQFNYVVKRCDLRFDYEPYYRIALKRIQISKEKLEIGLVDRYIKRTPYHSHQALTEMEQVLDRELAAMQRKMPANMLWQLCSLASEWSVTATFEQPIPVFVANRHFKEQIPTPLTDSACDKPWIRGKDNEYARLINLENDIAVMMHLNNIRDRQLTQAMDRYNLPRLRSKL